MPSGRLLGPIAETLREWLTPTAWSVLAGRRRTGAYHGGALTPYLGTAFTSATALSQIDLMVVRPDRQIVLVVEIADRPLPPDRILGIAANVLLADAVRHGSADYVLADSQLLIATVVAPQGQARLRLSALEDRLNWARWAFMKAGKPRLQAIRIATADSPDALPDLVLTEARVMVALPHRRPEPAGPASAG